jgi:nucleotide-binding universal stress UspA family protein
LTGAEILLLHVSTGSAAQWQENLNLCDSREMREDREFLEKSVRSSGERISRSRCATRSVSLRAILRTAQAERCDLIAMATYGHRLISDLVHGTTITKVRHESTTPLFLVKAEMN